MIGIIYKSTNIITLKVYIGLTITSFKRRKSTHIRKAKKGSLYFFHRAIRAYGENSFKWEIIEQFDCEKEELLKILNEKEKYYVAFYKSNCDKFGYNLTSGGDAQIELSINFWNSEKGSKRKLYLSDKYTEFWSDLANREHHKQFMDNFYLSEEGLILKLKHKKFMYDYYHGEDAKLNKSKTSNWFVLAESPSHEQMIFVSSKEPNTYFGRDIGLRCFVKKVGDEWIPTQKSKLYGWKFKAIPKDNSLL